jgi:hypothetical protein
VVGSRVGLGVGIGVGAPVGLEVGVRLGRMDGVREGGRLGRVVGTSEGRVEGRCGEGARHGSVDSTADERPDFSNHRRRRSELLSVDPCRLGPWHTTLWARFLPHHQSQLLMHGSICGTRSSYVHHQGTPATESDYSCGVGARLTSVGTLEGSLEGVAVGCRDGRSLGVAVGMRLGVALGRAVGREEGVLEGRGGVVGKGVREVWPRALSPFPACVELRVVFLRRGQG